MLAKAFVSVASGLAVLGLSLIILPTLFSATIALCLCWAVAYGMMLFLDAFPAYISREHILLLTTQLVVTAILTPWMGLTTEAVNAWFGKYFFAIFVILPLVYEIMRNQVWKKRE